MSYCWERFAPAAHRSCSIRSHNPRRVRSAVGLIVLGILPFIVAPLSSHADGVRSAGIDDLADLEYKREVLMYCGISDGQAVEGFLDRQNALIAQHALNRDMTLEAASIARQRAHAEWQNRGLGGFRGWCRNEGSEYAAILRSYVIDSQ